MKFRVFSVLLLGFLTACGDTSPPITSNIKAVSLTASSSVIAIGQTINLTATVSGTDPFSNAVTWTATGGVLSNTTATTATFTASDTASTALITATSSMDTSKSDSSSVVIKAPIQNKTGELLPGGSSIVAGNTNPALVQAEAGAFSTPSIATVETFDVTAVKYGNDIAIIAPQTVVKITGSSLNTTENKKIFIVAPSNNPETTSVQEFAEVRIDDGNGNIYTYLDNYDPVEENVIVISTKKLGQIFKGNVPAEVKISVQPLDASAFFSSTQQPKIKNLRKESYANVTTGLLTFDDSFDKSNFSDLDRICAFNRRFDW
jgi:hypothetical protein